MRPMKPVKPFTVIDGQRDQRTVVCTWCGGCFLDHAELRQHRIASPRCGRNKMVNNQTQTKLGLADIVGEQPGEATLNRTRAATCKHEVTEKLRNSEGTVFARQCTYCYTRLGP